MMAFGGGELIDWSVVRLCNLGQLDVCGALPLPTLPPPAPPPGAELAGNGADVSEAVLTQVAALLARADVSYVCVPRARPPRAAAAATDGCVLQRTHARDAHACNPKALFADARRVSRSFPNRALPMDARRGGGAVHEAVLARCATAFAVEGAALCCVEAIPCSAFFVAAADNNPACVSRRAQ
jgi:hypothetical protein